MAVDNNKDRRIPPHAVLAALLGLSLLFMLECSAESSPKAGMEITGTVTDYQNNAPAKGIEVKLYTYHPNPVLEYLPPTGHIMGTDITNEEGRFKLNVGSDLLARLEKQGYNRVVVFVAPGISGFKVIDLADGAITVDLVTGAPAPAGMK